MNQTTGQNNMGSLRDGVELSHEDLVAALVNFEEQGNQPSGMQVILKIAVLATLFQADGQDKGEEDLHLGLDSVANTIMNIFESVFKTKDAFVGYVYSFERSGKMAHVHLFLMFDPQFSYQ